MDLFSTITNIVGGVLEKVIPDVNKRAELQLEITKQMMANQQEIISAASSVMVADAASESWLTRNMRPIVVSWILMIMTGIFIEALLGDTLLIISAMARIPDQMWNMLMIGTFGYMGLRSVEKIAETVKGAK